MIVPELIPPNSPSFDGLYFLPKFGRQQYPIRLRRVYEHESVRQDYVTHWLVIASDRRERGNLMVLALKDCGIASVATLPRNDVNGDFGIGDYFY